MSKTSLNLIKPVLQKHKVYFLSTFLKDISSESIDLLTSAPLDLINSSISSSINKIKV